MPHTSLSVWATYNLSGQDVPVTTKYTLWQPHNSIAQTFLNLPGWDSTQTTQKSSAWCIRACQWISHNHSMTIPIHIIIYPSLCQAFITTHTSCITDLYSGNMCSVMSWYEPNSSSSSSPCTFPVYAMLTMKTQMSRSGISQEIQINFSHISSFMQSVRAPCCMSNCIIVAAERAKKKMAGKSCIRTLGIAQVNVPGLLFHWLFTLMQQNQRLSTTSAYSGQSLPWQPA